MGLDRYKVLGISLLAFLHIALDDFDTLSELLCYLPKAC